MDDKVYLGIVWLEGKVYETINTGEISGKIERQTKNIPIYIQHGTINECEEGIKKIIEKIKNDNKYQGSVYESNRIA